MGALADTALAHEFPSLDRDGLVYLDAAATSQTPRAVLDAMEDYYAHHRASVHRGVYPLAAEATELFEGARERIAAWLGWGARETIFTRNATEALNLVAYSWGGANLGPGDRVLVTEMEHHSNLVPWQLACERTGATFDWVGIDADGQQGVEGIEVQLPFLVEADDRELGAAAQRELLPGHEVRVVLHLGDDHAVARPDVGVAPGVGHEVERLGDVLGEDRLLDAPAQPPRDALARAFEELGRLGGQRVDAAVHARAVVGVVILHGIEDHARRLRRRAGVEVDEALAIERGELVSDRRVGQGAHGYAAAAASSRTQP